MLETYPTEAIIAHERPVPAERPATTPTEPAAGVTQLLAVPPEAPLRMAEQSFG